MPEDTPHRDNDNDLPIFVGWMSFLEWLLPTISRFPRRTQHNFGQRIESLALDIVEDLVEARYTRERRAVLRRANLRLEKLRILLRLCHTLQFLSHQGYEHAMRSINETGQMLGGWIKQQAGEQSDETFR